MQMNNGISGAPLGRFRHILIIGQVIKTNATHFVSRTGFKSTWHEALLLAGAVAPLFVDIVPKKYWGLLIGGAVFFIVVGTVRGMFTRSDSIAIEKDRDDLRQRLNELEDLESSRRADFAVAVAVTLKKLAHEVQVWNSHSRLTIYAHNGTGFQAFLRKSDNPIREKFGRVVYPEDQGMIAKAWSEGFPRVCTSLPAGEPAYSRKLLKEFKIPPKTTKDFGMKSRSILAIRISDTANQSAPHIGVLVIESVNPTGVNDEHQARLGASHLFKTMQVQIATSRQFLPDVTNAQEMGF